MLFRQKTQIKRAAALLLATALCAVALCSALAIGMAIGHRCVGADCAICCRVTVCKCILRIVTAAGAIGTASVVLCRTDAARVEADSPAERHRTLVDLKVKFSD